MTIKVIETKKPDVELNSSRLEMGHAYRLVSARDRKVCGDVYICVGGQTYTMFNIHYRTRRVAEELDKWVEVDLTITIEEKN